MQLKLEDWIKGYILHRMYGLVDCPRCGDNTHAISLAEWRCGICGMHPEEEGPRPKRYLKGVTELLEVNK